MNKLQAKFIALDGPDGCGKSTQTRLLAEWLGKNGIDVVTFRDPGTTAIGEKVRQILLNPEHLTMSTVTEVMLYMAARTQLWVEEIAPALAQNKCVILDRWLSSTCAYQGHAGQFGIEKIIRIAEDCLERTWPDLTVILDAELETAAGRLDRQLDRMEAKGKQYHQKVREGFLQLAKERKDFAVVDASSDIETVHKEVIQAVEKML